MRHALLTLMIIAMPALAGTRSLPRHTPKGHSVRVGSATHSVRRGETAGRIAAANGLSLAQLQALNPGRNLAKLSIGTRLHITRPARIASRNTDRVEPSQGGAAVLEKGQTLYALARANGISVQALMAANPGLNPRRVRIGTVLHLPGGAASQAPEDEAPAPGEEAASLPPIPGAAPDAPSDLDSLPAIPEADRPVAREASLIPSDEPGAEPLLPFRPADPNNLDLFWPVETRSISSYWGPRTRTRVIRVKNRRKKRVHYRGRHKGIDLPAPMHTEIYAALDGVVTYAGKARGYGNVVRIDHGNGVSTVYGHESVTLVHEGDIVHRGEKIAEVGRAGNATGPHLHFELRIDGVAQNPLPVLDDTEEVPGDLAAQNGDGGGPSAD